MRLVDMLHSLGADKRGGSTAYEAGAYMEGEGTGERWEQKENTEGEDAVRETVGIIVRQMVASALKRSEEELEDRIEKVLCSVANAQTACL